MECSEISNLIMKYVDGDISEVELKFLNKHMQFCESCRQEFEMMTEVIKCINELPEVSPPYNFEAKVMERISKQRVRSSMLNMLIGAAGMLVFAYYTMIFVILPLIQDMSVVQSLLGYGRYAFGLVGKYLMSIIVNLPITIDNLFKLRNILINNYMHIMLFIAGAVMIFNLGLIRIINLQRE